MADLVTNMVESGRHQNASEVFGRGRRSGIDFGKLEAARRRLGIEGDEEGWPEEFNDPAFSREVLGLDEENQAK